MCFFNACNNSLPEEIAAVADQLPEEVNFNFHIKPLISDRCFKCHGPDANQRKGELRLDNEADAFKSVISPEATASLILKSGSPEKSEIFHRIMSSDVEYMMPPPESNLYLSAYEKGLITKWINQGAKYEKHWAFVSPKNSRIPDLNDAWISNEIDHFILEKIVDKELSPSPSASPSTLLRRATLDLTGLPPTPAEIENFINDTSDNSYSDKLDALLAREQYGERMALEWLDVARYADTHGYQDDGMRTTWPWRDWVIQAFNQNLPYDDFITWQLAGDLLDNPTKDQLLATCFNRNHPQSQEGGVVDEEYRVEYVADRTNTLGKAFLGLTLECARCHDHKYDPISQKDYYSLFAYFNNNNESGIVPYNGEASPTVFLPTKNAAVALDSLGHVIDSLSEFLVSDRYIEEFEKWYKQIPEEVDIAYDYKLSADFSFEKELKASDKTMNLDRRAPGKLPKKSKLVTSFLNHSKNKADAGIFGDVVRRPLLVEGHVGKGLAFQGDAGVRFNRDLDFDRNQPFSISIWVKPLRDSLEGPIFNNSNDAFEGYRGWLCKMNMDGTLSFQFNHVWPDNAIDIKTHDPLKINQWSHVVLSYDGSSKANGIRFFINGETPEHTILADNLYKSLLHGRHKTNWSSFPFILGMGMTKSIEDLCMDELKVYRRQLSEPEIQALFQGKKNFRKSQFDKNDLVDHYLFSGYNAEYNHKDDLITAVRKEENLLTTDEIEVMIMHERKEVRPTYVLDRGMYDQHRSEVEPAVPEVFSNLSADQPANRLELAQWLVRPEHPLTSRVAVNRIWKMLFGKGIVATQEDFGSQGNLPSHPELLDFLALKLIDLDWDMKAFIKYIMQSSVYTQSSIASKKSKSVDPENRTYAHFPAHRLSAETIRDGALAASGLLVEQVGGPSVYPYQPEGLWEALATRNAVTYTQQTGDSLYRRSMYTVWKRSSPPPSMMTFDAPDRYYCVVNRQNTATPLQSLVLMNDVQFLEASKVLAEKMMEHSSGDPIVFAFKSLIGRRPNNEEYALLTEQYKHALEDLKLDSESVIAWLSSGEYHSDSKYDKTELAANTMIASTIMNFDEFVMKR